MQQLPQNDDLDEVKLLHQQVLRCPKDAGITGADDNHISSNLQHAGASADDGIQSKQKKQQKQRHLKGTPPAYDLTMSSHIMD